jgi:hypothetical protein
MQQVDEQTDAPSATISRLIWSAVAINVVLVSALLTAGLIFAVDFAMAADVALKFSVLTWGVLIPVGLLSLGRQVRQETPAEPLHDSWLDGEP